MSTAFYELLWLFFIYSILGWGIETAAAAVTKHRFVNRGVLGGPVCTVYGVAAVILTVFLQELVEEKSWFFLFVGCGVWATVIEWAAGRFLEKVHHGRWWDYSKKRWNLDGYICLQYSLLWAVLGVAALAYGNPILLSLFRMIPERVGHVLIWVLLGILTVDILGSYLVVLNLQQKFPQIETVHNRLGAWTLRLGWWIAGRVERRVKRAYPEIHRVEKARQKTAVFAEGCSFYKLVMLFFIGSFLGDITETIFCRLTVGVWMSRSSVVWGPFSLVWGMAVTFATLLLYNYRNRSDSFLFLFGTVMGGAYEYICSVCTELFFGTVFWDYSKIPFNLGGRINLLYCFFWGIAAVVWLKGLYPVLSNWIEKIPVKPGKIISWCLIVLMTADIAVSCMALVRYSARNAGQPASAGWEIWIDQQFDDQRMEQIYPNAKMVN